MIKSGATIQNRYLNNPYPSNYNPMGRPGNFDVARPHDSSSVFDTGMPKDVSPYQPRVAVSVSIQPKSVFKPKRLQRQAKQVNGAKWGQTALKSIFGGEENVITNYMAQRLLGIVEDDRMTESMQQDDPMLEFRDPAISSSTSEAPIGSARSDASMVDGARPDLTDLSLGEMSLQISIPPPPPMPPVPASIPPGFNPFLLPENQPQGFDAGLQAALDDVTMDAVGEVETQPTEAATQGGLMIPLPPPPPPLIVQETAAGRATVRQRDRTAVDKFLRPFTSADIKDVKLKPVGETSRVQKPKQDDMMDQMKAALEKRRKAMSGSE
jgi:hypothetical protein